jgi:hypothetical protein
MQIISKNMKTKITVGIIHKNRMYQNAHRHSVLRIYAKGNMYSLSPPRVHSVPIVSRFNIISAKISFTLLSSFSKLKPILIAFVYCRKDKFTTAFFFLFMLAK